MVGIKTKYKEMTNETSVLLLSLLAKNIKVLNCIIDAVAGSMGLNACAVELRMKNMAIPLHGRYKHVMRIHSYQQIISLTRWVLQNYIESGGSLDMSSERNNSKSLGI